jgi:hypothetical protein
VSLCSRWLPVTVSHLLRLSISVLFLIAGCSGVLLAGAQSPAGVKTINFGRDIRPILSDNCFACHGPDEQNQQAGLRLDTREGAFADRGGYQVIVPGRASESRLYQRISAKDESTRMPPAAFERQLTEKQIELIRLWIDQGAKWETHWAYVPPKRPELPNVKNQAWPRNPIDHFILSRLEREGLKPSPEADRTTLLRRLSFDLTGLPPTPGEVEVFLSDSSPDAYEKQVDRLLGSPHYGERMAMQWLDLARYADTHGYHIDSHRDMWHWRDWVIAAYNRNLPFDEFTTEQLAGDLLPSPTPPQKVATGFSRNHMINFEGGAIPEEYQTEYVVDRVETTSAVWMAMTMGCARCHDHKYDPIRQKDFYRFFAFFNGIPEKGLDGQAGNAQPMEQLPSPEQNAQLLRLKQEIAAREKALPEAELDPLLGEWEKARLMTLPLPPQQGLVAHYEFDGHLSDTSGHYHHARTVRGDVTFGPGVIGKAGEFNGETQLSFGNIAAFDSTDAFSLAFWFSKAGKDELAVIHKQDATQGRRGYELRFDESVPVGDLKRGSHLYVNLIHRWPDDCIQIKTQTRIRMGQAQHLVLNYDGSGKASGVRLFLDGKLVAVEVIRDRLTGSIQNSSPLEIGNKELANAYRGQLDDLRIYRRQLEAAEIEQLSLHNPIRWMLSSDTSKFTKEQRDARRERLREYFLTFDAPEPYRNTYAELTRLRKEKLELDKKVPTSMVMHESEQPRETFLLIRGDYRNHGEKVSTGVPSSLPPLPGDAPANRLGLARWLLDPAHPLTARVAVNRYWQMYFGLGIVRTAEDFGSQGEVPVHPELLDWLATEFIRTSWDIKTMQRLLVTSATYRQSSRVSADLLERDPENRLLAHGPRFRLPAEMVRDNALFVSGLLNPQTGGPSVFPYQPKGLWEEMAFGDVFSAQTYTPSHGKDLYRRSMYTFWKRTVPPPSLATFDAPDREKCVARRAVTNTPLQALVLMNDPTYVEAARALAQRALIEAGGDSAKRIQFVFRQATGRKPTPVETQLLQDLAQKQLAIYRRDKAAAAKLLQVGEWASSDKLDGSELAAWTLVASSILNLDETITKE